MRERRFFNSLVCLFAVGLQTLHSVPSARAGSTESHPQASACEARRSLSPAETDAVLMLNARLSHLEKHFGKASFESALSEMLAKSWPSLPKPAPVYVERILNLVDQARLRHAVAATIGLEHASWLAFERHMKNVTLIGGTANDLASPFEKTAIALVRAVGEHRPPGAKAPEGLGKPQEWQVRNADALARVTHMYAYLAQQRQVNGELRDEEAAATAKTVATVAVGFVGLSVLYSTLVFAGPFVAGAGAAAAKFGTASISPILLAKLAETAAGATVGMVGAPAAQTALDSYHVVSEAWKRSSNMETSYICELSHQIDNWKEQAPSKLLKASALGGGMGTAGGLLTFSTRSAKFVLYLTGTGVAVAQLYATGQMLVKGVESYSYFQLASEASAVGDYETARRHLEHARELAQVSGEHMLEAVIIGILSYHVSPLVGRSPSTTPALMKTEKANVRLKPRAKTFGNVS